MCVRARARVCVWLCVCVYQLGQTVLQAAVDSGQEEMLRFLLTQPGAADKINQPLWVTAFLPICYVCLFVNQIK